MDMEVQSKLDKHFRKSRAFAILGLGASILYIVIAEVLRCNGFVGFSDTAPTLLVRFLFGAVAIFVVIAMWIIRRALRCAPKADRLPVVLFRNMLGLVFLGECICLIGFAPIIFYGLYVDFYVICLLGIVVQGVFFPRYDAWISWLAYT